MKKNKWYVWGVLAGLLVFGMTLVGCIIKPGEGFGTVYEVGWENTNGGEFETAGRGSVFVKNGFNRIAAWS